MIDRAGSRFPAFESRDYRRLFGNTFFASASNWALLLGRGWLVFELTDSSFAVGVVTLAGLAPFFIAGPLGGAAADRFDRRRLSIIAASVAIASSVVLATLTLADVVTVWQIVGLAVVSGSARAFAGPSEEAMIPSLVPREHLLNAVALSGISRHGSRVAGPLFGTVLLASIGAGWVFALSAGLLLLAVWQVWQIEYRTPPHIVAAGAEREGPLRAVWHSIGTGFAYVESDQRVALIIVFAVFHCTLTMGFDALLPKLSTDIGGGDVTFGAISIGIGVGSIAGTLGLSMLRGQAVQGYMLAVVGMGSGLSLVALGLALHPASVTAAAILVGMTQATYMALSVALVQQVVPDEVRGRVLSIFWTLSGGDMALMNFGSGWLADHIGVRPLLIIPGLLWIGVFAAGALSLPELRHVLRRGGFRPRAAPAAAVAGDAAG